MRKLTSKQKWIIGCCVAIVPALLIAAVIFVIFVIYEILMTQISLV